MTVGDMKISGWIARIGFAAFAALSLATGSAQAQQAPLELTLREGRSQPVKVAVTPFISRDPRAQSYGALLANVVAQDLNASGLFQAFDASGLIGPLVNFDAPPNFAEIRGRTDALGVVTGEVGFESDGRLRVGFRLWDLGREEQSVGFSYQASPDDWRRMAHRTADAIYERLTGDPGYFETRIVFVSESGPKDRRVKRLALMDSDGEGLRYLTNGEELVLTPRYSPKGQVLTYIGYGRGRPRIYLMNIGTGQREVLGAFDGMMFAPRFSPDGRKVLMSIERRGNADIYEMDLASRRLNRLTRDPAIDTAPSYSPDGRRIVFESDRGGAQQLYVQSLGGAEAQRISFGSGRYASPVWSPRGDMIAFVKIENGRFGIGVMNADGSGERIVTQSFLDESPTWAPNGRKLMFYRQDAGDRGRAVLMTIDIRGGEPRPQPTPEGASDPDWGPSMAQDNG